MPTRRPARPLLAACAVVATILALSGCDLDRRIDGETDRPDADRSTASQQPPTSPASPAPGPTLRVATVDLGEVTLRVGARKAPRVGPGTSPGTRAITFTLPRGGTARLALASPGALDVDSDGSIAVLDRSGTTVAAVGPPTTPSRAGAGADADSPPGVDVREVDASRAAVEVDTRSGPTQRGSGNKGTNDPVRVTLIAGTEALESATWGENEGGRSLAVDPTDWARHAGEAGTDLIRTQLVAAEPDAGTTTMEDQLVCHAVGAPDKTTWNLEPWRPDVGLILTATAHCNPV